MSTASLLTLNALDSFVVASFYKFVALPEFTSLQPELISVMEQFNIRGTILLAHEGINGTVAGSRDEIDALLGWLRSLEPLQDLTHKEAFTEEMPFLRTKVRLKKEIVTIGLSDVDPTQTVGTYVEPADWNALISDPDILLVDTRNDYEVQIGTFKNAINPRTESFREFPTFTKQVLEKHRGKKIAMFCTGGIRCEKSTAFLKGEGFDDVYHLKGGILKYLEEVSPEDSMWEGECFVFDERVAVNHQLEKGTYDQCHACRRPITEADKQRPEYVPGVSCHHCYTMTSDEQRARYAEREKQIRLAEERDEQHIGADVVTRMQERKQQKREMKNRQRSGSE